MPRNLKQATQARQSKKAANRVAKPSKDPESTKSPESA
jgi:hypothetical protein